MRLHAGSGSVGSTTSTIGSGGGARGRSPEDPPLPSASGCRAPAPGERRGSRPATCLRRRPFHAVPSTLSWRTSSFPATPPPLPKLRWPQLHEEDEQVCGPTRRPASSPSATRRSPGRRGGGRGEAPLLLLSLSLPPRQRASLLIPVSSLFWWILLGEVSWSSSPPRATLLLGGIGSRVW